MKESLCLIKKCSECCDPVKVPRTFPIDRIPIDEKGDKLWEYEGIAVSAETPDGVKLSAYKCKKFYKKTGLCKDYRNRPEICRNTECESYCSGKENDRKSDSKQRYLIIKEKRENL